jgi:hypothetical protein
MLAAPMNLGRPAHKPVPGVIHLEKSIAPESDHMELRRDRLRLLAQESESSRDDAKRASVRFCNGRA